MTTISDDSIGRVRAETRQQGSPGDPAEAGARRFWVWASAGWLTSVCVTVVVAAGDAIPVAIGGMALAAVGNAMAVPEPGVPASDGPEVRPQL